MYGAGHVNLLMHGSTDVCVTVQAAGQHVKRTGKLVFDEAVQHFALKPVWCHVQLTYHMIAFLLAAR